MRAVLLVGVFLLFAVVSGANEHPNLGIPDWSVDPAAYDYDGTVTGAVLVEGVQVGQDGDMLGGFVGGICRGVATALETPAGTYIFPLHVYSDAPAGEFISFKYYDSLGDQVGEISETLEFMPDMTIGTMTSPFEFNVVAGGAPDGWWVDPGEFEYNGSITAAVRIEGPDVLAAGIQVGDVGDYLAAFVGSSCRGVSESWETPEGNYVFPLTVYSNEPAGESMSFRYYDSASGAIWTVDEAIDFTPDMTIGSLPSPFQMNIGRHTVCESRFYVPISPWAYPGDTASVEIWAEFDVPIKGYSIAMKMDTEDLEVLEASISGTLADGAESFESSSDASWITAVALCPTDGPFMPPDSGAILWMKIRVKEEAEYPVSHLIRFLHRPDPGGDVNCMVLQDGTGEAPALTDWHFEVPGGLLLAGSIVFDPPAIRGFNPPSIILVQVVLPVICAPEEFEDMLLICPRGQVTPDFAPIPGDPLNDVDSPGVTLSLSTSQVLPILQSGENEVVLSGVACGRQFEARGHIDLLGDARREYLGDISIRAADDHRTEFDITLVDPGLVLVRIVDIQGRVLRVLKDEPVSANTLTVCWNHKDARGEAASSGVYFCQVIVDGQPLGSKKVVILR